MSLQPIDPNEVIFRPAFEYQETTMQVPCGYASILSQLEDGLICAFEAIIYLDLNRMSVWFNGETRWISASKLARVYDMSLRWVREVLYVRLSKWATRFKIGQKGSRYELLHHDCVLDEVPLDKYGDPKKFAVAMGAGGPFERLYAGDISWRACLIWIVLKYYSQWDPTKANCGQTDAMTMDLLRKRVRMKKQHVCDAIKELEGAGMLKRLSKPWEASVFQLFPRPRPKSKVEHFKDQHERKKGRPGFPESEPYTDKQYWYSYNRLVRCQIEDLQFEIRKRGRKKWKPVGIEAVLKMKGGGAIAEDLQNWCLMSAGLRESTFLGSSPTAGGGSETAGDSSQSAGLENIGF